MPGYVMCKVGRGMWNVECGNVEGAGWKEGGGRWEMGAVCLRVGGVADHKAQLAQRTPFNHHRPHPHTPLPFFFILCNATRHGIEMYKTHLHRQNNSHIWQFVEERHRPFHHRRWIRSNGEPRLLQNVAELNGPQPPVANRRRELH